MSDRPGILTFVFASLILAVGWCAWQWQIAEAEAVFARQQLAECERLARRIFRLRRAPARFEDSLRSNDALARLVEDGVKLAGVETRNISEISPGEPRRIGDTPYKEQLTTVQLREITLPQLIAFLLSVPEVDRAIQIGTVNLRAPIGGNSAVSRQPTAELWNTELTLTSRFYAPIVETAR